MPLLDSIVDEDGGRTVDVDADVDALLRALHKLKTIGEWTSIVEGRRRPYHVDRVVRVDNSVTIFRFQK